MIHRGSCRLLLHPPQSGVRNMAVDEALLAEVDELGKPTLRIYSWSSPTLSLGYFQQFADRPTSLVDLPCVRRLSGGGAIVHENDVTYSMVFPSRSGRPLVGNSPSTVETVHSAVATFLRERYPGLPAPLLFPSIRADERPAKASLPPEPFLCFERRSPNDLTASESKILGSAQRRSKGRLLQHGSILLGRSPHTPQLLGVAELTKETTVPRDGKDRESLPAGLATAIAAALGLELEAGELTRAELVAADRFESKHRTPSWVMQREPGLADA